MITKTIQNNQVIYILKTYDNYGLSRDFINNTPIDYEDHSGCEKGPYHLYYIPNDYRTAAALDLLNQVMRPLNFGNTHKGNMREADYYDNIPMMVNYILELKPDWTLFLKDIIKNFDRTYSKGKEDSLFSLIFENDRIFNND